MLLVLALGACGDDNANLTVRVITGLVPGPEFRLAQVAVLTQAGAAGNTHVVASSEATARFGSDYARGINVASFALAPGAYRIRVRLLRPTGVLLVERMISLTLTNDMILPVHLTRDCVGVVCPAPGGSPELSTCLQGQCVDPRCLPSAAEFCPSVSFCNEASECHAVAACAESECREGLCTPAALEDACGETEWCNPDVGAGCQPLMPSDSMSLCGTICAQPGEPCRFGYWHCIEGASMSCDALANRPVGYVCDVDRTCDSAGDCVGEVSATPGFTITPTTGLTTGEDGRSTSFAVSLRAAPTSDVVLALHSSDETEGTASPSMLRFTPLDWNAVHTVTITGVDDADRDGNITYSIVTDAATSDDTRYAGMNPPDIFVRNIDNDTAGVTVGGPVGLVTTESGGTDTFTLVLNRAPTSDVVISVASDTPSEADLAISSVTFTADNWNAPQSIVVTGVDDFSRDGDMAFHIVTGAATSADVDYNGLDVADIFGINRDDESAAILVSRTTGLMTSELSSSDMFTVVLQSAPSGTVTIPITSSDETEGQVAASPISFTPANWNVPQAIIVTGVDDSSADGDQVFYIDVGPAISTDINYRRLSGERVMLVNVDDESIGISVVPMHALTTDEDGSADGISVRLNSQPSADVVFDVTSSDLSEGTVSPNSLTFTPSDWNNPQGITLTGVDDLVRDGNQGYEVLLHVASTTDPDYSALPDTHIAASNVDNESPSVRIVPPDDLSTDEWGSGASFDIVLGSPPSANVTVPISSDTPLEGTPDQSSVTFTPATWNTPQTITVTGGNDFIIDGARVYHILIGAAVSADAEYNGIDAADLNAINYDNDFAGIAPSTTTLVTDESGTTAPFTLVLTSQPTADVTIAISSSDLTEGTVAPASVTFTPSDWSTPQTITVTGVDDALMDTDISYALVIAPAVSADTNFSGLDVPDLMVTNTNDDFLPFYPGTGIKASNAQAMDYFGSAIALSADGTVLAVGAYSEASNATGINGDQSNNAATGAGAVYVFVRTGMTWMQQAYIKASNTDASDGFGSAVALSADGNTLLVGASREASNATGVGGNQASNAAANAGAAYVFTRSGSVWTQQAYLKQSNTDPNDSFGSAVSLSSDGNTAVVTAPGEASNAVGINGVQSNNAMSNAGAAYVFTRAGTVWTQEAYIKAFNTNMTDIFGRSASLSADGNTLAIGSFFEASNATGINGDQSNNSMLGAGAAYIFTRAGTVWAQEAYIKASNTNANDYFSENLSLAADGNTLVVGATGEASNARGINGDQSNNAAGYSGAVYVFVRVGMAWSQQAYIKSSNSDGGDRFGSAISLSGDGNTLAVGAYYEASCATGIEGNQADNSCVAVGAAYVFERTGSVWTQSEYLKPTYSSNSDGFGDVLRISADASTLVVGAQREDGAATGVGGVTGDDSAFNAGAVYVYDSP